MTDKKILNLTEVAQRIGVPKRTCHNWLRADRFPIEPLPNTHPRKWSVDSVDEWLAGARGDAE